VNANLAFGVKPAPAMCQVCKLYAQGALISLINVESTLTDFEKFHPPQKNPPSTSIDFITKVSDIIAETNDDFSHNPIELKNFILKVFFLI
jgi:hypothetical protein